MSFKIQLTECLAYVYLNECLNLEALNVYDPLIPDCDVFSLNNSNFTDFWFLPCLFIDSDSVFHSA